MDCSMVPASILAPVVEEQALDYQSKDEHTDEVKACHDYPTERLE
jgi:hypothetical protein